MKTQGHVFKYPDNVDTDVIIPARYLNTPNAQDLAKHCMEDIDTTFVSKVQPGDIMVAGWNFGCGSECEQAAEEIQAGDTVSIDFDTGVISDLTTGKTYQAEPFPKFIQNIIRKGGLLASLQEV